MLEHGRPKDIYEPDDLHMSRAGYVIWRPLVRTPLLQDADAEDKSCRARWKN